MSDYRMERIERLLQELKYEVTRGMMEGEIDEDMGFEFYVPMSKKIPKGVVFCSFRTRPQTDMLYLAQEGPRLKLVSKTP